MTDPMPRQPEPEFMDANDEADAYAAADFDEVNQAVVDRLLELVGPRDEACVVDLGTGPADIPVRLVRSRPGWRVVAVDASGAMLRHARQAIDRARLGHAIDLVLADAKATGLADASFDVILSNSILHHITDVDRFWAEVKRIARPGAHALLRDLARPPDADAARAIVDRYARDETELLREEYYRSLLSSYTVEEVRSQLARAGLDCLQVAMATDRHLDVFGRIGTSDTFSCS